jgi:hypothetical protein
MTWHYTHTGDAAALAAVASLPSLMGEDTKTILPAQSPRLVDAGPVREWLKGMTAKTWRVIRDTWLKELESPRAVITGA